MKKLVRDLIPQIINKSGRKAIYYQSSDEEYRRFLKEKLKEETQEFFESESMEELADVLEVVESIYVAYNFDKRAVDHLRQEKALLRGGFKEKIILVNIETNSHA